MPIDYRLYAPNWKLISKFIRFYRAKNKCEWCGAENYKPHPETGSRVILTVAHLDHNRDNNSFFNLSALCQKCHLDYDRNGKKNRKHYECTVINCHTIHHARGLCKKHYARQYPLLHYAKSSA
jgi:hypothetical protein